MGLPPVSTKRPRSPPCGVFQATRNRRLVGGYATAGPGSCELPCELSEICFGVVRNQLGPRYETTRANTCFCAPTV